MIEYNFTSQQAEELTQKALKAYIDITDVTDKNNGKLYDGEVFTPHDVVCDMCNLANAKLSDLKATVLEPACGSGNILIEILRRKLATALVLSKNLDELQENMLWAVKSIYGIDISETNISACKDRLLGILSSLSTNLGISDFKESEFLYVLDKNILCGDSLRTDFSVYNWYTNKYELLYEKPVSNDEFSIWDM